MSDLQGKLQTLASKLGLGAAGGPAAGAAVHTTEVTVPWSEGQSGAEVDWTDYEVDADSVRFYRRARYHNGEWLFPYVHYRTITEPVSKLAERVEHLVNEEGYKILTVQPNGSGMLAAVLYSTTVHPLATPARVTKLAVAEPETFDDRSDEWAANKGD
jgi:hypothetical protein